MFILDVQLSICFAILIAVRRKHQRAVYSAFAISSGKTHGLAGKAIGTESASTTACAMMLNSLEEDARGT